MKTLFKVLALSILLTAFSALAFAQDKPALDTLYAQFRTELKVKCGDRSAALATGNKIVELYGTDEINKEVIDFVKGKVTEIKEKDPVCKREDAYVAAVKTKNWNEVFTTGEVIVNAEGDSPKGLDVKLDLVQVGFDRTLEKNDAFNGKTLAYAKSALDAINAGKPSNSKAYGALFQFKTKEEALSWLNYYVGWLMYNKTSQKKEALPYLFKAAQVGTAKKNDTSIYTNIGSYYFDEAGRLYTEYTDKLKANNNEPNDEIKNLLGLARGTADRALDAFGRAYNIVKNDTAKAALRTSIADTLVKLYKFRFQLTEAKQADIDKYVADLVAKPMPDPATAVTPVVEAAPTTATTSTTSTTLSPNNAATVNETPTSATTTGKTTPTTKTTTTKTTTTVKKPVKKKGTR